VKAVPADGRSRERIAQARRLARQMLADGASLGLSAKELEQAMHDELDGGGA
jgi:hypothetical protein